MDIIFDKGKNQEMTKTENRSKFWEDSMIQDYYLNYYSNLSSRQLDKEFNEDIRSLTQALSKLSDSERKAFIEVLSRFIEFYMENKVEKEIDQSLFKILKF